jgi:hypothetical protein
MCTYKCNLDLNFHLANVTLATKAPQKMLSEKNCRTISQAIHPLELQRRTGRTHKLVERSLQNFSVPPKHGIHDTLLNKPVTQSYIYFSQQSMAFANFYQNKLGALTLNSKWVSPIPLDPSNKMGHNDTLRRFQEKDKGYYVPSDTLGVPRGGVQRSPEGGPQGRGRDLIPQSRA